MKLNSIFLLVLAACVASVWSEPGEEFNDEDFSTPEPESETVKKDEKPKYVKPVPVGEYYFVETFEENVIGTKWIKSNAKKEDVEEVIAKYDGLWRSNRAAKFS